MSLRDVLDILLTGNETKMAAWLGVSRGRLRRWKEEPENVPLWAAKKLALIQGYQLQITTINHTYVL